MIVFVPIGKQVTLTANLAGERVDEITQATFELFRLVNDQEQALGAPVTAAVNNRRASVDWTARGPNPTEMACSVYYRVRAGELTAVGGAEIVVFRDRVELTIKDANDTARPLPLALCECTVAPDPLYTPPRGAPAQRTRVRRADDTGKIVFDNLPPGNVRFVFRSPFELVRWTDGRDRGEAREAVVARRVRAAFVFPDPAQLVSGVHKQWVNYKADATTHDPAHPELGPILKVRAKVATDPLAGGGRAGDRIYLKAVYGGENSPRNDSPEPVFEGHDGGPGKGPYIESKTLAADDGEVEFTLNLGAAGGDRVVLTVGGTRAPEDQSITVENWRKVHLQIHRPASLVLPGNVYDPAIISAVRTEFARAFIDLELDPVVPLPDDLGGTVVSQQVILRLNNPNLNSPNPLIFLPGGSEKQMLGPRPVPDFPPRIAVVIGHAACTQSSESFTLDLSSRRSAWVESTQGLSFYPVLFDGDDVVQNIQEAAPKTSLSNAQREIKSGWSDGQGNRGDVDGTFIECDRDNSRRFRVVLPNAQPGDPGSLVSGRNKVKVKFKLAGYQFQGGSSSGRWLSVVGLPSVAAIKTAVNLLHELGHNFNQAAVNGDFFPGVTPDHPNTYGRGSPTDDDERGHAGPHCRAGFPTKHWGEADYSTQVRKGVHGTCIMFGGTGPKTAYNKLRFCADCLRFLRAANLHTL